MINTPFPPHNLNNIIIFDCYENAKTNIINYIKL